MNGNLFVTGGLGFVGIHLVRQWLAANNGHVVVFDAGFHENRLPLLDPSRRVTVVAGDIRDESLLSRALTECTPASVVHLAALHYIPDCTAHPDRARNINVEGTRVLARLARSMSCVTHFVFASSAAVYADASEPITETAPTAPMDVYGHSKLEGERIIEQEFEKTRIATRIMRLFNVYGANDPVPHLIPELIAQASRNAVIKLGRTDTSRDYVHVDDVARALIAASRDGGSQHDVFNVGTGLATSVETLIARLRIMTGRGDQLLVEQDPSRFRVADRRFLTADVEKLTRTGWYPSIPLEAGLRALVDDAFTADPDPDRPRNPSFTPRLLPRGGSAPGLR